jgi:hypothetical protein
VVSLRPQTIDKYGRTVAEAFRNGQNVNLAMVSSGQAFPYRKYLSVCDGSAYLAAEAAAQRQRVGVWAVHGGITRPWEWRAERRENPPPAFSPRPAKGPASGASGGMTGGGSMPRSSSGGGGGGGRYYCKNLSHLEAQRLLSQGHTYLDRNGDGEACEGKR